MKRLISLILVLSMILVNITVVSVSAKEEAGTIRYERASLLADTQICARTAPQNDNSTYNFGGKDYVGITRNGTANYFLSKFSLPRVNENEALVNAKLKVYTRRAPTNISTGNDYGVARFSSDTWVEGTLTGQAPDSWDGSTPVLNREDGIIGRDTATMNGTGHVSYKTTGPNTFDNSLVDSCKTTLTPDMLVEEGAVEIDVTSILMSDYELGKEYTSLALYNITESPTSGGNLTNWEVYCKEYNNGQFAAELELEFVAENPKYYAELDADVLVSSNSSQANLNYGGAATAQVNGQQRSVWLRFNLPSFENEYVESAKLRIYTTTAVYNDLPLTISRAADDSWVEGDFAPPATGTGQNPTDEILAARPPEGSRAIVGSFNDNTNGGKLGGELAPQVLKSDPDPITYPVTASSNSWIELDVSNIIFNDYKNGSTKTSLVLSDYSDRRSGPTIVTKENEALGSSNKAQLIIETSTEPISEVTKLGFISYDGSVRLVWNDPDCGTFERVNIYEDNTLIGFAEKGIQNYIVDGLTNNEEHTYTIKTQSKSGVESNGLDIVAKANADSPDKAPSDVSNLSAAGGDGKITVSWTDPVEIDFEKVVVDCDGQEIFVNRGVETVEIGGLLNNENYTVTVKTISYGGKSSDGLIVSAETVISDERIIDDFDGKSKFNSMTFVDGDTPDSSGYYGSFLSNRSNTYRQADIQIDECRNVAATGFKVWVKADRAAASNENIYFALLQNGGDDENDADNPNKVTFIYNIGNLVHTNEWSELYIPFDEFLRNTTKFDPSNPEISSLSLRIYVNATSDAPINFSMDSLRYAAVVPEVENLALTGADGRIILTYSEPDAYDFRCVNVYIDDTFVMEIEKGKCFGLIDGVENGISADIKITLCDNQGRESAGITEEATPQNAGFDVANVRFTDEYGKKIERFMPQQTVEMSLCIVNDSENSASVNLYTAFYDGTNRLVQIDLDNVTLGVNGQKVIKKELVINKRAEYAKVFAWDDNMKAYTSAVTYPDIQDAEFSVSSYFGDSMVLQRDVRNSVWGTARSGETVTASFNGETVSTVAEAGQWQLYLPAFEASAEPSVLTVTCAGETKTFENVLVGEVWVASGQSNMAFQLSSVWEGQETIDNTEESNVRFFGENVMGSTEPVEEPKSAMWNKCVSSDTQFQSRSSAVATFFALKLYNELKEREGKTIPVAYLNVPRSGSIMQAWIRNDLLMKLPWSITGTTGYTDKAIFSSLYNNCIYPITRATVKGVIWFQGESNKANGFFELFDTLITNWRKEFNNENMPFIFMNLPAYGGGVGDTDTALKREQQYLASITIPNVAMASLLETGDKLDIHSWNKKPIGERMATVALEKVYGYGEDSSSPTYNSSVIEGDRIILKFDHVGEGLQALGDGDPLSGFEIAGEDNVFYPATATIVGKDTVEIYSENVPNPQKARYGWGDSPTVIKPISIERNVDENYVILTYESISDRYSVGDKIVGFKIVNNPEDLNRTSLTVVGYADATVISTSPAKVKVVGPNLDINGNPETTTQTIPFELSSEAVAEYCFSDFPFKTVNLANSYGYTAVPFRTYK